MHGILYEEASVWQFLMVSVAIGGWTAWMTGKGAAESWRTIRLVVLYTLLLGIGVRFMHHALFDGTMFSLRYYVVDTIVLMVFSVLGFRYTRTGQMTEKYYWLYEKAGPFSWKKKSV
jgi:tryptophan-rich sensory protein